MEITQDKLKKYGKLAGIGVVGAGLGAGAFSQADSGPSDTIKNLEDQVDELETENSELTDEVNELSDRPTEAEYTELQNQVAEMFSQEQVNEMLAREDVLEFLPVIADEDVEIESAGDLKADSDEAATDSRLEDSLTGVNPSFDADDLEGEEFDEARAYYSHDDSHDYEAVAREFEDSEDADEYEEELRQAVDVEDFEDSIDEDAAVIREGDTVVYLYGTANTDNYESYDFDAFTDQY